MKYYFLVVAVIILLPDLAQAQVGLVPTDLCDGPTCSACHIVELINRLIKWLIGIVILLFAVLAVWAGFGLVTSGGNPSALSDAKSRFTNAFIGFLIVLAAWLLVDTLMRGIVSGTDGSIKGYGPWSQVQCLSQSEVGIDPGKLDITIESTAEDQNSVAATSPGTFNQGLSPTCNPSTLNFPSCAVSVRTNDNMNPIFDPADGGSSLVKEGAEARMDETLAGPFAALQRSFGQPIIINDAIAKDGSSRETNTPGSRHFHGDALDLSTAGMSDADKVRLFREAKNAGFTGFGFGPTILHIDRGGKRSWDYGNSTYGGVSVEELKAEARN